MKKIHKIIKRKFGLSTNKNLHYFFHPSLTRRKRAKTFASEEAANLWAFNSGLNPEQFHLEEVGSNKRIQIVMDNGQNKNNIGKGDYL